MVWVWHCLAKASVVRQDAERLKEILKVPPEILCKKRREN